MGLQSGATSSTLLKTPTSQLAINGGSQHPDKRKAGGHGPTLADEIEHNLPNVSVLFPTPTTQDGANDGGPSQFERNTPPLNTMVKMLPTPLAGDAKAARNSTATRHKTPPTGIHPGDTLTDILVPNENTPGLLLPTPAANDSGNTPEDHLRKKPGRTQVTSLQIIADYGLFPSGGKVLPTPKGSDAEKGGPNMRGSSGDYALPAIGNLLPAETALVGTDWGEYEPAIRRWEAIFGRTSPAPTEPRGKGGSQRLSPRFVEWMMGLDKGHVTDVDITNNAMLKALGNGVVPQQAAAAIWHLLGRFVTVYGQR